MIRYNHTIQLFWNKLLWLLKYNEIWRKILFSKSPPNFCVLNMCHVLSKPLLQRPGLRAREKWPVHYRPNKTWRQCSMRGTRFPVLSPLLERRATARAMQTLVQNQPPLLNDCVILNMFLDLSLSYLICKNDTLMIQNEKLFTINPLKFLCS